MSDTTAALERQAALVTGGSSGIGRASAEQLAAAGASVALAARREDELRALAGDIEADGGEALVVPTDVMLLETVADADTDNWRRMVEVNLLAVMNATHAALPIMREQGRGHVVNVSSAAGRQASASGYNATKFGVDGFTEAFRQEVAEDGIRTTLIEPGIVDTGLQEHIPDEAIKRKTEAWVDSLDPLTGEDIAETIRFAVTRPRHVSVNELLVRSIQQEM